MPHTAAYSHPASPLDDAAERRALLSMLGHELRTPLNGLLGMQQLLELTSLDPTQKRYLADARRSAERLSDMLLAMLDLADAAYHGLSVHCDLTDLRTLVNKAEDDCAAIAQRVGAPFGWVVDSPLPEEAEIDGGRWRQILKILVDNAVKYGEGRGAAVLISAAPYRADAVRLTARVLDAGAGVDEGAADRMFVPYGNVAVHRDRPQDGPGIGLALARKLAMLMGGDITWESEPGLGSRFTATAVCALGPKAQMAVDARASRTARRVPTGAGTPASPPA